MMRTLCEWKSGEAGPLDECECCHKAIPRDGDVHFVPDGGLSPDGTYVGVCCIDILVPNRNKGRSHDRSGRAAAAFELDSEKA